MATAGQLWELLHEAASHVEAGELRESIQEALDSGCSLSEHKEILEVCDEIERIVHDYENETCSTPGGLEHLGDVWRLLSKWNDKLKAVRDGETTVG